MLTARLNVNFDTVTQYHGLSLYVSLRLISLYLNNYKGNLDWPPIIDTKLSKKLLK